MIGRFLAPAFLSALLALAACTGAAPGFPGLPDAEVVRVSAGGDGPRILAVTAHPDDEAAFAGTLYKAATHLGGACDLVVITNGEGGFKYATLAERMYGLELTVEEVGRAHLPAIRREELLEAAGLLGLRDVHFLRQWDHRYTQDVQEVLGPEADVWAVDAVRAYLADLMGREGYEFVLVFAPTPTTHGHHQAASMLALEAAATLAPSEQPLCLAAAGADEADAPRPVTIERGLATLAAGDPFVFDRRQPFGHRDRLDYRILVNLAIAAHRSQGTMQLVLNSRPVERYYPFAFQGERLHPSAARLFESLREPQFTPREYDTSAGTNAGAR